LAGEAARGADGGLTDFGVRRAAAGGAGRRAATRFFGAFADLAPGFASFRAGRFAARLGDVFRRRLCEARERGAALRRELAARPRPRVRERRVRAVCFFAMEPTPCAFVVTIG